MPLAYFLKKYQNLKDNYKQHGIIRIRNRVIYRKVTYLLQIKDLSEEVTFSRNKELQIQRIEQSHLSRLLEFCEKYDVSTENLHPIKMKRFFDNRYHGFLALINGEIIGYAWWVDNKISPEKNHPDILLYEIELKDGDAYGTNTYIAPPYRGNSNSIKFMHEFLLELKKMGYKKLYGITNPANISALWTYNVLGLKTIKKFFLHKFFDSTMYINKLVYVTNGLQHPTRPLEYRILCSFRCGDRQK